MNQIEKAAEVLKLGGIIAYPTETVYGLGANIFNEIAIRRLFEVKHKSLSKPISVAVSNFKMLDSIACVFEKDKEILKKLLPGPVTIILPKKEVVSDLLTTGNGLIGIRFPENEIIREIIEKAGFPITATSANFSGEEDVTEAKYVKPEVDFVVEGECKYKRPSTVVDLINRRILRESVNIEEVKQALKLS
ncbi:MAG: threonylcarbamoyl-AMP synthase [Candidatus Aenigmarchaeota archaeon]|nr:threonylcarbamoyl-AMP synthase [Candidatus Aenigmarchaeota archaeon]